MKTLQQAVKQLYQTREYTKASIQTLVLGAVGEMGELAEAILLSQCPDFKPSLRKQALQVDRQDIAREVGDCITYLLGLCNALDIEPYFGWQDEH